MSNKQGKDPLDEWIKEAVEDSYHQIEIPDPLPSWEKLKKQLDRNRRKQVWRKRLFLAGAAILVFILGGITFGNAQVSTAFNPIYIVAKKVQNEVTTLLFGSNSSNPDLAKTDPPPSDTFFEGTSLNEKYNTIAEAQQRTTFHIFTPQYVPETFEFTRINLQFNLNGKTESASLVYKSESQFITVTQRSLDSNYMISIGNHDPSSEVEEIEINGEKAFIVLHSNGRSTLQWLQNGILIDISGPLSQEEMINMGEQLK